MEKEEYDEILLRIADGGKVNLHLIYRSIIFQSICSKYKNAKDLKNNLDEALELTKQICLNLDPTIERDKKQNKEKEVE